MSGLLLLQELWKKQEFDDALRLVDGLLSTSPDCPHLLVSRGMLIQLLDHQHGPPLRDAEQAFLKALSLAPENLDALEELANFYDAVTPNLPKAQEYAGRYLELVEPVRKKMAAILREH